MSHSHNIRGDSGFKNGRAAIRTRFVRRGTIRSDFPRSSGENLPDQRSRKCDISGTQPTDHSRIVSWRTLGSECHSRSFPEIGPSRMRPSRPVDPDFRETSLSGFPRSVAGSEEGATTVQYALVVALIAAVSSFSLWWLSIQLQYTFLQLASKILGI